ncbi:hypothetical protein GC170_10295 [bacterium]|nr:hypothetical protein [bacterium]
MTVRDRLHRATISGVLAFGLCSSTGCSSWPWKSGGRDAERLTRVIHAENARLKDVVVQLRSSNEDMAQRSLDDASRIARLEEENEQFRMSIAAYQTERERMARSFQSLQEQVRLALGDRSDILTTSFVGDPDSKPASFAPTVHDSAPPEGRVSGSGNELEIAIDEWFAPNTAILKDGVESRLARLGRWLSARLPAEGVVRFVVVNATIAEQRRPGSADSVSGQDRTELRENGIALETVRARRLWDAIQAHLPVDSSAKIRFDENSNLPQTTSPASVPSQLTVPLAVKS